jgi:hypothetical protein
VKALAKKGVKNLVVVTPGFAADCLETLEEISVDNARVFTRAGGTNFAHIQENRAASPTHRPTQTSSRSSDRRIRRRHVESIIHYNFSARSEG